MPSWNSKDGVWTPAKEKVALYNKEGEPFIYEGADRAATDYLQETGEEFLGKPFYDDPEIIDRAHERRQTVDEFCKVKLNPAAKREAAFKEAEAKVNMHHAPSRKSAEKIINSGGRNTAGSGHLEGGMGDGSDPLADAVSSVDKKKGK